jgi:N4-gp56 family major capsid protein
MALTNFAALTADQKMVWSKDLWQAARDLTFINKFTGGSDAVIQRITELTKTERGELVIMHLLADLVDDGVIGDNEREGNEEEMMSYNQKITIDLISHGVRQKGKLAEQKTVINFRENAKDRLAYWLANRMDQLAFLTLSGIAYTYANNGAARTSGAFATLAFAANVTAPSTKRGLVWSATNGLKSAYQGYTNATLLSTDTLTYKAIVDLGVYAKTHYVKPLNVGGKEYYVCFIRPEGLAQLKKDDNYQRAVTNLALKEGQNSPWFTGGIVTVDGIVFHEHRLLFTTLGAADTAKWGSGGHVDGSRLLLCGPQALGFADLGAPEWSEKWFNYDSSPGVNIDKMFGFLKPVFYSIYDKSTEDFGVITVDYAI